MADYWKSQDRKYCDFCKCWITDNKPSVDFHEKGRRHQLNVAKKLRSITRQSEKTQKELQHFDLTLKQIESAALEAYQKDVQNNGDITSIAINKKLKDDNLAVKGGKKVWREATSEKGNYYWNILTNETVWVPPAEGYLSLKEQKEEGDKQLQQQYIAIAKKNQVEDLLRAQEEKQQKEEERARLAREKLKERSVKDDDFLKPTVSGPILPEGKTQPYGQWQTIRTVEPVDLQLPQQEYFEVPVVPEPEPVVKEFKEKVVGEIEGSETGFKKRKLGSGAKRNTRQRLDVD